MSTVESMRESKGRISFFVRLIESSAHWRLLLFYFRPRIEPSPHSNHFCERCFCHSGLNYFVFYLAKAETEKKLPLKFGQVSRHQLSPIGSSGSEWSHWPNLIYFQPGTLILFTGRALWIVLETCFSHIHIFLKSWMASNKKVYNFWHHFLAQYFLSFHVAMIHYIQSYSTRNQL